MVQVVGRREGARREGPGLVSRGVVDELRLVQETGIGCEHGGETTIEAVLRETALTDGARMA